FSDNPLQTAVLNIFVALEYRFPNLVVGSITRDTVKKALSNGISVEQIISHLIAHAHPQTRKNNFLLPVRVQDQIRLWELEKNRLKSQEGGTVLLHEIFVINGGHSGYLYNVFTSPADYELVRCFFGTLDRHANTKSFIERRTGGNA
ncbi:transcription factor Tfb2-domain-containing protein, partial [Mycena polygramma]